MSYIFIFILLYYLINTHSLKHKYYLLHYKIFICLLLLKFLFHSKCFIHLVYMFQFYFSLNLKNIFFVSINSKYKLNI